MDEKLTIVGPEPTEPSKKSPQKKFNIETLLIMAKYNMEFRKKLLEDRENTIKATGLSLTSRETMLFTSISKKQLEENIKEFRLPGVTKKSHPDWKRAVSVLILVSTLLSTTLGSMCNTPTGIVPDENNIVRPEDDQDMFVTKGIIPDEETIPEENDDENSEEQTENNDAE